MNSAFKQYWLYTALLLPLFIFFSYEATAQIKYQLYAESGYFNSQETGMNKKSKLLTRVNGEIRYEINESDKAASVLISLRPEIYGTKSPQNIIKSKAEAEYLIKTENIDYGINLSGMNNRYLEAGNDLIANIIFCTGQSELRFSGNQSLLLNLGYAFQSITSEIKQNYNIFFTDIKGSNIIFDALNISYGVYLEKFNMSNKQNILRDELSITNNGYRWGPQISINYFGSFIFNIDYNFLLHNSKFTSASSSEQLIRLVAGTIFLTDFSAFILVDYYKRNLKLNGDFKEGITPLYIPFHLENRIYLKAGYDAGTFTELYLKTGYLKENLYDNKYNFSGWHFLAGVQISN